MVRPWVKQGQTLAVRKVITKPKGGGKGAGQWVFVPNGANYSQVLAQHKRGQETVSFLFFSRKLVIGTSCESC